MKIRRPLAGSSLTGEDGLVLVEILVSLMLVGLLVVPLAGAAQTATMKAQATWEQAEEVGGEYAVARAGDAWDWGGAVSWAAWSPGPRLQVRTVLSGKEAVVLGIWVDGWFRGEYEPDAEGRVSLSPADLDAEAGQELVARTRVCGEPWGVPWRAIVPDHAGHLEPGRRAGEPGAPVEETDAAATVVHVPNLATALVGLSWIDPPIDAGDEGTPVMLPEPGDGWCEVTVAGVAQCWWRADGRLVDVYF